jgi:hypothetical protein
MISPLKAFDENTSQFLSLKAIKVATVLVEYWGIFMAKVF